MEEIKKEVEEAKTEEAVNEETAEAGDEIKAAKARKKKKANNDWNPDEAVKTLSKGKLILFKPFIADDVEIKELEYDFENLGGPEMVKAMDRGAQNGGNAFRITQEQAFELFIASAAKETDGVDATDMRRGLSSVDTVKAVQLATVFFAASSQAGNARITK